MFPIFPVDYPFIRKGHSFTMNSNRRARTKAVAITLLLAGLSALLAGVSVSAQQSTKPAGGVHAFSLETPSVAQSPDNGR